MHLPAGLSTVGSPNCAPLSCGSGGFNFDPPATTNHFFFETSNGRLPPKQTSDRRETLAKRVSDDLQFFIFRR